MISFCTQGHGYFEVLDSKLTEQELVKGLEEGRFILCMMDEKICDPDDNWKVVANVSIDDIDLEMFDFEVD